MSHLHQNSAEAKAASAQRKADELQIQATPDVQGPQGLIWVVQDAEEEGPGLAARASSGEGTRFTFSPPSPPPTYHSSQSNHEERLPLERYFLSPSMPSTALLLPHPSGQCCWLTSHCCHNYLIIIKDSEPVYSELSNLERLMRFSTKGTFWCCTEGWSSRDTRPPTDL